MTRWFNSSLKTRYSQIWEGVKTTTKPQQQQHKRIAGERYKLLHEIGQGVSSTVYLAIDTKTNKQCSVKKINKSWLAKQHRSSLLYQSGPRSRKSNSIAPSIEDTTTLGVAQTKKRKLNNCIAQDQQKSTHTCTEIDILKGLPAHENVISFIDAIEEPNSTDSVYIITEFAEKGIVMDVTPHEKSKPYPESMCKLIFKQLLNAVEHLHNSNVVHRDIKPQNLVLTKDNCVKLIDFGSAMNKNQPLNYQSKGSPAFMAPELIDKAYRNKKHSPFSVDIWALGVTLYCLVYGHLPFETYSILELYHDIIHEDVRHGSVKASPELCSLIDKLLEKDPQQRITMEELKMHPWVQSH